MSPRGARPKTPGGLVLHAEQATFTNEWTATTLVRISKRIVTEIQTIEVEIRREEIVISHESIPAANRARYPAGTAPALPPDLHFTLRTEIPAVTLTMMPTEHVTISVGVVEGTVDQTLELTAERLTLEQASSAGHAVQPGRQLAEPRP